MAFEYSRLDIAIDQIRVLEIIEGAQDDRICCTLKNRQLTKQDEPYMALSYMWASEPPSLMPQVPWKRSQALKTIEMDGDFNFGVTPNLYAALLQLRSQTTSTFIWIDQICINQACQEEKTHQIRLMGKIYRMASKTIVWLGPKNYQSVLGLKGLRTLLHLVNSLDSKPANLFWKHVAQWQWVLSVPAFLRLLRSPYFTRVWIVQEIALSREIEVWCGDVCIPLHTFTTVAGAATVGDIGSRQAQNFLKILGVRCHVFGDGADHSLQNAGWIVARDLTKDIFSILSLFRENRATLKRDQIYGLLGLCRAISNDQDFGIVEDTSHAVTCQQVYVNAAKAMLEGKRNLDIFAALRFQVREWNSEYIPSWVPDWSDSQHVTVPISTLCDDCASYKAEYRLGPGNHVDVYRPEALKLVGCEVDSIEALGDPCNTEFTPPSVQICLESIWTAAGSHRMQTFSDWWRLFNVCAADSEALVTAITCGQYQKDSVESVSGLVSRYLRRTTEEISRRTLGLVLFMTFEFLLELYILPAMTVLLYFVVPQCLAVPMATFCWTYSCLKGYPYLLVFETKPWETQFYNVGLNRMEGRRIARTRNKRFALVPQESKIGDKIYVFAGGKCPIVLRELHGAFRLHYWIIGECYMHKVMEEENTEEGQVIWIV